MIVGPMNDPSFLSSIPLFPLGTVLFPEGSLSLRIFEVRYLDMVRKCARAQAPFGVVALQSGSEVRRAGAATEQLYGEGTLAHITELQEAQTGLLLMHCRGGERFRLTRHEQLPHGLWVGDAELLATHTTVALAQGLVPSICARPPSCWPSFCRAMHRPQASRPCPRASRSTIAPGWPTAGPRCCPCPRPSSSNC